MSERLFVGIFALLLFCGGAAIAIVLPPFQVPDEIQHYTRAFEISRGVLFPPDTLAMPPSYVDDAAIFHPWIEDDDLTKTHHLAEAMRNRFGFFEKSAPDRITSPLHSEDIYGFPLYGPGALALAIVRPLHPTLIASLTCARLFTLFVCGLVIVAGLRVMPFGKELFAFVALFPTHLQQLASVSPDALVISLALFTTACILRTSFRNTRRLLARREWIAFAALAVAIGFAKIDIVVLGLLVLVPRTRFASTRAHVAFLATNVLVALVVLTLSPSLTTVTSQAYTAYHRSTHIELVPNVLFIVHHPAAMASDLLQTLHIYGPYYLTEMIGTFGWISFGMPMAFVALGIIVALALAVRIVLPHDRRDATRAICAAVGTAAVLAVFVSLFVTNEASGDLQRLASGSVLIEGIQGRYFLPFVVIAGIALGFASERRLRVDRFSSLFAGLLMIVGGVWTILASYY